MAPITTAGLINNSYYSSPPADANLSDKNKLTASIRNSLWFQDSGNMFNNVAVRIAGLRHLGLLCRRHPYLHLTLVGNLRVGFPAIAPTRK
jgi:hypothetical protein